MAEINRPNPLEARVFALQNAEQLLAEAATSLGGSR
jgi:hypothetical protein